MPDASFTHDDLRLILVERVGLDDVDVPDDPDVAFADIGLDSLAVVEVQLAVQQRFGFTVPDEDAHSMVTLRQAVDYVNRRLRPAEVA
jgi:minimal PKS acyl carrier protein